MKKQKYHSEFKNKTFKSKELFNNWLRKMTEYEIEFIDKGQDCLKWYIDKGGEVLNSNLQSSVWNGDIVDFSYLEVGKEIGVMDSDKMQTKFYDFIVEKIIDKSIKTSRY